MSSSNKRSRTSQASSVATGPVTVYVLVRTTDREDEPARYECGAESEVVGVYSTERLAEKAKLVETAGMDKGSDENDFSMGTDFVSTFQIFSQIIQNNVDTSELSDESDDSE